jgi:type II secretory pathway pseudopilin PulG
MNRPSMQCWESTARRRKTWQPGATLIELLVGLVVLGVLLVAVSTARARFLRQWGDAERRLAAVHAADALLAKWMQGPPAAIPLSGAGTLEGVADHRWRTHIVRDSTAASVGAIVLRLEIVDRRGHSTRDQRSGEPPAFSVDVLLHDPRAEDSRSSPDGGTSKSAR